MSIEIQRQPRRPDMTALPAELIDHFAAQGCQVGLRKHAPDVLGMDFSIGWRPVEIESLPLELQVVVRAAFEIREDHGLRGDCILAVRSNEAREQQAALMDEIRASQEDDQRWAAALEEEMQHLAGSTGRATGRSLLVGNVPLLRDQVVGGARLAGTHSHEPRPERRGRPPRTS